MPEEDKQENETNSIGDNGPIPPRDDLVKTAAKFLSSPNVATSPMDTKVAFLKKKGLSDAEIDLAVKQSDVMIQSRNFKISQYSDKQPLGYAPPWPQQSPWMKYRDIANSIALVAGAAYAVYWFYKKYIHPFLFGSRKVSLDARLTQLDSRITDGMDDLKSNVIRFKEDVERMTERKVENLTKQLDELKNEVSSLKKLLLNRKQFLGATQMTPAPLSIPAWQIACKPEQTEEKETEEEGVGSGTTGSDSSLEIIKE